MLIGCVSPSNGNINVIIRQRRQLIGEADVEDNFRIAGGEFVQKWAQELLAKTNHAAYSQLPHWGCLVTLDGLSALVELKQYLADLLKVDLADFSGFDNSRTALE